MLLWAAAAWTQSVPLVVQTYRAPAGVRFDTVALPDTSAAAPLVRYLLARYQDSGYVYAWGQWECGARRCRAVIYLGTPLQYAPALPFSRLRRLPYDSLHHYVTHGRPFAAAALTISQHTADSLTFGVKVRPDTFVQWDSLIVPKPVVHLPVLARLAGYRKGSPFSPRTLDSVRQGVEQVPWLRLIASPHVVFTPGRAHLFLPVEQVNQGWADGLLNLQQAGERKWVVTGRAEAVLNNLFRRAVYAELRYQRQELYTSFRARLAVPYLAATPLGLQGGIRTERFDSAYLTQQTDVAITFYRHLYQKISLGITTFWHAPLNDDSAQPIRKRWTLLSVQWDADFNGWGIPRRSYQLDVSVRPALTLPAYRVHFKSRYAGAFADKWETGIITEAAVVKDSPLTASDAFTMGGMDHLPGFRIDEIKAQDMAVVHAYVERRWQSTFVVGMRAYGGILRQYPEAEWTVPHGVGIYLRTRQKQLIYTIGYFAASLHRRIFMLDRNLIHVRFQYLIP